MKLLSPRLQYGSTPLDEVEINRIGTAWFQYATKDDKLYVLKFSGTSEGCGPKSPLSPNIEWKLFKTGDPNSFELISDEFARCQNHVYHFGELQRKMDATSFRIVRRVKNYGITIWLWSADKTNVYRGCEVKKVLHGGSFRKLDDFWGRDNNNVFCFATQRIYKGIDVETFEVKGDGRALDAAYNYALLPNPKFVGPEESIHNCFDDNNYAILKKTRRKQL